MLLKIPSGVSKPACFPITNLIEGTHPGDGADVVGDGDQRCPSQVLFGHRLPLLFGHHVTKAAELKQESVQGANTKV